MPSRWMAWTKEEHMKKQILSAFAVVTAISIAVITPTTALADDIKYSQSIYEKIGMDRSEIVSWVQDSRQNVYGKTEDEVMQYLIASAEEERSSNIQTDNAITRGSWSNQWFSRGVWIARDGMWSLSLQPTWWAAAATPTRYYYAESAWATIPPQFSSSRHWTAYPTASKMMKEQFDCHVRYGTLKTPYNLEPSRTSISQITCNWSEVVPCMTRFLACFIRQAPYLPLFLGSSSYSRETSIQRTKRFSYCGYPSFGCCSLQAPYWCLYRTYFSMRARASWIPMSSISTTRGLYGWRQQRPVWWTSVYPRIVPWTLSRSTRGSSNVTSYSIRLSDQSVSLRIETLTDADAAHAVRRQRVEAVQHTGTIHGHVGDGGDPV